MEAFGCDIGNGYGYVSILINKKEDPQPMLPPKYKLADGGGMPTDVYVAPPKGTPIMAFDMNKGCPMERTILRDPARGVHAVKSRLHEGYIQLEGINRPIQVDEMYAAIVRDLMILGNEQRKVMGQTPLYDLVFTYPVAYEKDINLLNRMQKAIEGVVIDNKHLQVVGRCPEPAAVAIDYLYYIRNIKKTTEKDYTILVYDLGHGTFDTALVRVGEKVGEDDEPYRVLDQDGVPDVGGKNFDEILYKEICRLLKEKYNFSPETPGQREAILVLAKEAKHKLSTDFIYPVEYVLPNKEDAELEITRKRFEELSEKMLMETMLAIQGMLERAEEKGEKVDAIVLSGGGSRMPMVEAMLKQTVEEEIPIVKYRTSEAVSFGAARYADGIGGAEGVESNTATTVANTTAPKERPKNTVLEQKTGYAYGIAFGEAGVVEVLIPSDAKLPAVSKTITLNSRMGRLDIRVYRSAKKRELREKLPNNNENCESVIYLPFDLPLNTDCRFTMTVEEDLNVSVTCVLPDGKVRKQGTADWLGNKRG